MTTPRRARRATLTIPDPRTLPAFKGARADALRETAATLRELAELLARAQLEITLGNYPAALHFLDHLPPLVTRAKTWTRRIPPRRSAFKTECPTHGGETYDACEPAHNLVCLDRYRAAGITPPKPAS